MENPINVYCDSWLHNNTCLEFEKFERCVIEATEIMTREDVKQQVEEFSFDLPFLLPPVSDNFACSRESSDWLKCF